MVLQNARGRVSCCAHRCCCKRPALTTSSLFLYPDDEQLDVDNDEHLDVDDGDKLGVDGGENLGDKLNVDDSNKLGLDDGNKLYVDGCGRLGVDNGNIIGVDNSVRLGMDDGDRLCVDDGDPLVVYSVHGMNVLQQYSRKHNNKQHQISLKRSNKNRNRMRILGLIRYTDQRSDLSNGQRERELEKLQCELESSARSLSVPSYQGQPR